MTKRIGCLTLTRDGIHSFGRVVMIRVTVHGCDSLRSTVGTLNLTRGEWESIP